MPPAGVPWTEPTGQEHRVRHDDCRAVAVIAGFVRRNLPGACRAGGGRAPALVLCIGTDRSTGDALGPLVGYKLAALNVAGVRVVGTLDQPVHASNLADTLARIRAEETGPVVAVDACLGRAENVGTISMGVGPLRPGAGVNKTLPPVGDLFITGTVNVGGMLEYLVLQNTRLSLVMRMAETIAAGLERAFRALDPASRAADTLQPGLLPASGSPGG